MKIIKNKTKHTGFSTLFDSALIVLLVPSGRSLAGPEGSWTGQGRILNWLKRFDQFLMLFWFVLGASSGENGSKMA